MPDVCPRKIRQIILQQSMRAHVGHIGSALSVVEIIACLYGHVLRVTDTADPDRDRLVLSKGHSALALYAALALRGFISTGQLDTFCGDGTLLGVHPERDLNGVDFSSGSLGQGLSIGAGAALAAKLQKSSRRTYVLMSDAEMDEGSVWEAAMFSAHHGLHNLCGIVDLNGQQAFGYTKDVLRLPDLADRWRRFGWDVHEVDGHDLGALKEKMGSLDASAPHILIAKTTFGRGVSFMENKIKWHYWPMSDDEYARATVEVGA